MKKEEKRAITSSSFNPLSWSVQLSFGLIFFAGLLTNDAWRGNLALVSGAYEISPGQAALFMSLAVVGWPVGSFLAGPLSRLVGDFRLLGVSLILAPLATLVGYFLPYEVALGLRLLSGACCSIALIVTHSVVARTYEGQDHVVILSRMSAGRLGALLITTPAFGYLAEWVDPITFALILLVLCAVSMAPYFLFAGRHIHANLDEVPHCSKMSLRDRWHEAFPNSLATQVFLLAALTIGLVNAIMVTQSWMFGDIMGLTPDLIGWVLVSRASGSLVGSLITPWFSRTFGLSKASVIQHVVIFAGFLAMVVCDLVGLLGDGSQAAWIIAGLFMFIACFQPTPLVNTLRTEAGVKSTEGIGLQQALSDLLGATVAILFPVTLSMMGSPLLGMLVGFALFAGVSAALMVRIHFERKALLHEVVTAA